MQWVKGLTVVAQVTVEVQVRSLAWCIGLRIWHCHSCGTGRSCSSNSIPGPGTSMGQQWGAVGKEFRRRPHTDHSNYN